MHFIVLRFTAGHKSMVPNLFRYIPLLLILEFFISPMLHKFNMVAEKVKKVICEMTQIARCGLKQSRSPQGSFGGLSPQTKLQDPQIETWKTINQWSFVNF